MKPPPPPLRRPPQLAHPSPVSSVPWSFLEQIDAPQWVDLTLEATLIGTEGHDPWFDQCHRHHAISFAETNPAITGLRLRKHKEANGVHTIVSLIPSTDHARERKKSGCEDKRLLKKVTSSPHDEDIHRASTSGCSQKTRSGSQNHDSTISTISNRTSSSSSFTKYTRRSSERSSRGRSSSEDGSFVSTGLRLEGSKGSSPKQMDDSFGTPSEDGKKTDSFFICPAKPKLRFSFQRRTSLLLNSQALHVTSDRQSPVSSVLTDESTGSCELEKEVVSNVDNNSKARMGSFAIDITGRVKAAKSFTRRVQTRVQLLDKDTIGSKINILPSRPLTNRTIKYEVNTRTKIAGNQVSSTRPFFPGKENKSANPTCFSSTMKNNSIRVRCVKSSVTGIAPQASSPASSAKSKCRSTSITGNLQRKRIETKHHAIGFPGKTSKLEKDLQDIVAQHNQKIRTLRVHSLRKQFR